MEKIDTNLIRITHFINPSAFWFKYESSFIGNKLFDTFNEELTNYYEQHRLRCSYKPQIKEIVAVYYHPWSKWIRGRVDSIIELVSCKNNYIIWAIDFGVPILVEQGNDIQKLIAKYAEAQIQANIYFGGVANLIPANYKFDVIKNRNIFAASEKWSEFAVKHFEKLIQNADSINFIRRTALRVFLKEQNEEVTQHFGDIEIILNVNKKRRPESRLIKSKLALKVTDVLEFFDYLEKLKLNQIPRWKRNNGTSSYITQNLNKIILVQTKPVETNNGDSVISDTDSDSHISDTDKDSEYYEEIVKKQERLKVDDIVENWIKRNEIECGFETNIECNSIEDVNMDFVEYKRKKFKAKNITLPQPKPSSFDFINGVNITKNIKSQVHIENNSYVSGLKNSHKQGTVQFEKEDNNLPFDKSQINLKKNSLENFIKLPNKQILEDKPNKKSSTKSIIGKFLAKRYGTSNLECIEKFDKNNEISSEQISMPKQVELLNSTENIIDIKNSKLFSNSQDNQSDSFDFHKEDIKTKSVNNNRIKKFNDIYNTNNKVIIPAGFDLSRLQEKSKISEKLNISFGSTRNKFDFEYEGQKNLNFHDEEW